MTRPAPAASTSAPHSSTPTTSQDQTLTTGSAGSPAGSVPLRSELGRHLDAEWDRLTQQHHHQQILAGWRRDRPALTECKTLHDVVNAVAGTSPTRSSAEPAGSRDAVLGALLDLAQSGDQFAGRIIVQGMGGLMERLARTTGGVDPADQLEDRVHAAVAELWDIISGYPLSRCPTGIATRIRLDVLHRITPHRHTLGSRYGAPHAQPLHAELPSTGIDPAVAATETIRTDWALDELTGWAIERGVLTHEQAGLLLDTYPPHAVRRPTHRTPDAQRQQCSRIKRKLIAAVREELAAHTQTDGHATTKPVGSGAAARHVNLAA